MFEQRQVDWLGVLVAGLMVIAGVSVIAYAVAVFISFSTTNFGGYGLYILVGLLGIGGLALIGMGVRFVALSWAGNDVV